MCTSAKEDGSKSGSSGRDGVALRSARGGVQTRAQSPIKVQDGTRDGTKGELDLRLLLWFQACKC